MQIVNGSNSVPAKIPRLAVYMSEEVKGHLEKLAYKERRSASSMAAILLEEALRARGYEITGEQNDDEKSD
jgi:hypothetical protein